MKITADFPYNDGSSGALPRFAEEVVSGRAAFYWVGIQERNGSARGISGRRY
jgi:hypothetical protein